MNEQHREIIELALFDLESKSGVRWGPEYMEEFAAAIRAALAEIDLLRADLDLALSAEISRVRLAELAQRTAEVAKANAERDEAVNIERERCLRIVRSVNNYSNPMTADDCAHLIERGEVQP
jgi:hypothetical protein